MVRSTIIFTILLVVGCATTYTLSPQFTPQTTLPLNPYGSLTMLSVIDARPQAETLGRIAGTSPGKPDYAIEVIGDKNFKDPLPTSIEKTLKEQFMARNMFKPIVSSVGAPYVIEIMVNHYLMTLDRTQLLTPGMTEARKEKAMAKMAVMLDVKVLFAKYKGDTLIKQVFHLEDQIEDTYAHLRRPGPGTELSQQIIREFTEQLIGLLNDVLNPKPVEQPPIEPLPLDTELTPPVEEPVAPTLEPADTLQPPTEPTPEPEPEPIPVPAPEGQ